MSDIRSIIHISVRQLVEFLLRSGSIDNRHKVSAEGAMQEGSRIHRMIQRKMGPEYTSEVPLSILIGDEEFDIQIEGRADGIFTRTPGQQSLFVPEATHFIDEIKGVYRDLKKMQEPSPVHLAQAKCYAAIYLREEGLPLIGVQMTYCNMDTEEIRRFEYSYTADEINEWFDALVEDYRKWARFEYDFKKMRQDSIHSLEFPFEYREGQKELASQVYRTIYLGKRLFLEAPTGVGKTISTLFPAIKALGEGRGDRIFYLTAKTLTMTVAQNTFQILRDHGLRMKTVFITAKEKACFMEEVSCNPETCPYAKGHYDRINEALFELLCSEDGFDRETILAHARKHEVCPYELSLDLSLFADAVICDYNYVFDPVVYLRRFFAEGVKTDHSKDGLGDSIFLVDEAHNLVDRAREMYSAVLSKEAFHEHAKLVAPFDAKLSRSMKSAAKVLLDYQRLTGEVQVLTNIEPFLLTLTRVAGYFEEFLEEDEGSALRDEVLDFYFEIRHFLNMADLCGEDYIIYTEQEDEEFKIHLFCVHPAANLRGRLDKGRSTIFFSATLLPVSYYMDLLSGDLNDYTVYAKSSFPGENRGVFISSDVSTKYTRRGPQLYSRIAAQISEILKLKRGNYLVFFPSYRFLQDVKAAFEEHILTDTINFFDDSYEKNGEIELISQTPSMDEASREEFLRRFEKAEDEKTLVGFCVMGGIFSEGIDLKDDCLIGAIVVGTGLPQVCPERELIRDYFEQREGKGFDYAYLYPGMNKVLQSAGRVIRTHTDVGIVALLDERFLGNSYKNLFPMEWEQIQVGNQDKLTKLVEEFWKQHDRKG